MQNDKNLTKTDIIVKQKKEARQRYNMKHKDKINEKRRAHYQLIKDDETSKTKNRRNAKTHYYKTIEIINEALINNENVKAIITKCIKSN
jgi:DNA invertase Pin-like site-specific DNA recombinase